ncbi:glycoside hydrolase [Staphylotrichum tortipilum]|uniref:Glycoside hydrolase n=1 Tax=Staphylotrichum tortipilum TaxID=2831512 RepID=A0AAN6RPC3_9PEZI|nr:glycoside hydrolase [Staphylotrichum longicolle]
MDIKEEVGPPSCALGASMALGSRLFGREQEKHAATRLVEGCTWICNAWGRGAMPSISTLMECPSTDGCSWDEDVWREEVVRAAKDSLVIKDEVRGGSVDAIIEREQLPKGFTTRTRGWYRLEHEAIGGVFVLYRMTGHPDLLESAWDMFTAINRTWSTAVDTPRKHDGTYMLPQAADLLNPSWLGPTLRYFYLVFSDPELVSLDDFVFN